MSNIPEQLQKKIRNLPALPTSAQEALNLLRSKEVDYSLLEETLVKDPLLSVRVLSVANSPFYGHGKINNIKQACMILGVHTTRNIVLAAGIMQKLKASKANYLDIESLWRHSLETGIACKVLAELVDVHEDEAFTAGLLHDIGSMILDIYFFDEYCRVFEYQKECQCLLPEAEEHVLGIDHCRVGALIAGHWRLPSNIVDAIKYYNKPFEAQAPLLAALVNIANIISKELKYRQSDETYAFQISADLLKHVGIDMADVNGIVPKVESLSSSTGILLS